MNEQQNETPSSPAKRLFQIRCLFSAKVLFELECESMKLCVEAAVKARADLTDAYLTGADLAGANLTGAYLTGAYLTGANLAGAYFTGANLTGADLADADLTGANLADADLADVRDDFWAILAGAPREIPGLRAALVAGKINGSTYTGPCACLVGTIANVRGCDYTALGTIKPNSDRPAERFFLAIKTGDTPESNAAAKVVLGWIDEFAANMRAAFGPPLSPETAVMA